MGFDFPHLGDSHIGKNSMVISVLKYSSVDCIASTLNAVQIDFVDPN